MSPTKRIPSWLPGALISIALIGAILYFVDLDDMVNAVRRANYGLLAVSFALSFAWMALRAKVWQTLLRNRPTFADTFFTVGEGYLLNAFLPFRLGELGRVFLISRKSKMQFAEVLPTIVIERVVDLGITAAILLASLPFVVGAQGSERIGIIVGEVLGANGRLLHLRQAPLQQLLRLRIHQITAPARLVHNRGKPVL